MGLQYRSISYRNPDGPVATELFSTDDYSIAVRGIDTTIIVSGHGAYRFQIDWADWFKEYDASGKIPYIRCVLGGVSVTTFAPQRSCLLFITAFDEASSIHIIVPFAEIRDTAKKCR